MVFGMILILKDMDFLGQRLVHLDFLHLCFSKT